MLLPLLVLAGAMHAAPSCPAGVSVAQFRLEATRPGTSYSIPVDRVNRLVKGDIITLTPMGPELEKARAALLVLTAGQELQVLETVKADAPVRWTLPVDAAAIAVAYGPKGFDSGRMKTLVSKDAELIGQLAAYSEKTAQTELLLKALETGSTDDRAFDGALKGIASTNAGATLNRASPADQQTLAMLRALNPALNSYDPLATDQKQRWQQSATLASSVAGLFYGNYIGLAGGGAALMLNLRGMMFPKTELRSALLRGNTLCAATREAPRSKLGFLWARRLPGGEPPPLRPAQLAHAPVNMSGAIPMEGQEEQLAALARAFRWRAVNAAGKKFDVTVIAPAAEKALRVSGIPEPGLYALEADWDWAALTMLGALEVLPLSDYAKVRLAAASADRLVVNAGKVRLRLEGTSLHFLEAVEWKRAGDALAKPVAVPFAVAADGASAEIEIDTGSVHSPYELTLRQRGGAAATLAALVQLPPPLIEGLPVTVFRGERQTVALRGHGLERIESITSANPYTHWDREKLELTIEPATDSAIELRVEGRNEPVRLRQALSIQAPRPKVVSVLRATQPAGSVARGAREIDASQPLSFSLQFEGSAGEVEVGCKGDARLEGVESRPIGSGSVYVTIPATRRAACELEAAIGGSLPAAVGTVVALPRIDAFELTDEEAGPQRYRGELKGQQLERIAKTGWTKDLAVEVAELPAPFEEGQRLRIVMPWPAPKPHAPLLIWLRGENTPRETTARF